MESLTKREKEIVKLIVKGLTNKEIAKELFLSVHTIKANIENIYEKTNINNRVLLAISALRYFDSEF